MPRAEYTVSDTVSRGAAHKRRVRAARRAGVTLRPFTDPEPARRRIAVLRQAGWSRDALSAACGVSVICLERLHRGQRTKIRPQTEWRILCCNLDPRRVPAHLFVPSIGTQRRIAALMYMQWGYKDMARQSGLYWTVFERAMHRDRVSAGLAAAVADLYDRLWSYVGPSKRTGTVARKNQRLGPLAWDDHSIDDPSAQPVGILKISPQGVRA